MSVINMRSILLFSFVWLISLATQAQDTITRTDGSAFAAKITQIGVSEIRYKKWSDPEGPTYVENKSALHAIRLSNGIREDFNPILRTQQSVPGVTSDTIIKKDGSYITAKVTEVTGTEIKYKSAGNPDGPTYVELRSSISSIHFAGGLVETIDDGKADSGPITLSSAPVQQQYNGNNTSSNNDYYGGGGSGQPNYDRNYIKQTHGYFLYNDKRLNEREMHNVLLATKDKELISLVQSARDAHALKYVGFGAIPLGIASVVVLASSVNYYGQLNRGKATTAGVLALAAVACPVISIVYGHKRAEYNRIAVRMYNDRY